MREVNGARQQALLDVDPDLGRMLPAQRHDAALGITVTVRDLRAGPLDVARLRAASPSHLGLLVIDGVVVREIMLEGTFSSELLGQGDIVRPWSMDDAIGLLETTARWTLLSDVSVALLDRRVATELCGFPELYAALIDRLNQRSTRLATTQAISQTTRVDRRLVALFRHLAERWGRMTPQGVHVPLRLSHRLLGQLVGARRPTVTSAIAELAGRGELVRRRDGTWLIALPVASGAATPTPVAA